jgi:hypothetical protein
MVILIGQIGQERGTEGWMDGWMDEWMDGWMDGWTETHISYINRSMLVAHVCMSVKEQAAPTLATYLLSTWCTVLY